MSQGRYEVSGTRAGMLKRRAGRDMLSQLAVSLLTHQICPFTRLNPALMLSLIEYQPHFGDFNR